MGPRAAGELARALRLAPAALGATASAAATAIQHPMTISGHRTTKLPIRSNSPPALASSCLATR